MTDKTEHKFGNSLHAVSQGECRESGSFKFGLHFQSMTMVFNYRDTISLNDQIVVADAVCHWWVWLHG